MVEGAGHNALKWFLGRLWQRDRVHRTRNAVYHRAAKLWGAGGLRRGSQSMRDLALQSGYHPTQIQRARKALNLKFGRLTPRGSFLISFEQVEDMLAWLKRDYWSKKLRVYRCLWCATEDKPHHAGGLCMRCYQAHRRACLALGVPHAPPVLLRHLQRSGAPADTIAPMLADLGRGWVPERGQLSQLAPWPKLGLAWGLRAR